MLHFTPNADIDLHDSRMEGLQKSNGGLEVYVRAWDENMLVFVFHEVRHFADWTAVADNLWEFGEVSPSALIDQTKLRMECTKWSREWIDRIRHFCFMDDTGQPVIEIIAESYEIKVGKPPTNAG